MTHLVVSSTLFFAFLAMNESPSISDAEWRVMHEVWLSEPVTSSEIISLLANSTQWSAGTIKTLLHRLTQKGILDFQRKGNRYLYRSKFTEAQCVDRVGDQLLHTVFQGRPIPMLTYMVQSARLSGSEVETLQQLLNEIQQALPQSAEEALKKNHIADETSPRTRRAA